MSRLVQRLSIVMSSLLFWGQCTHEMMLGITPINYGKRNEREWYYNKLGSGTDSLYILQGLLQRARTSPSMSIFTHEFIVEGE